MRHRDGSATSVPTEGTYRSSRDRDSDSKIPARGNHRGVQATQKGTCRVPGSPAQVLERSLYHSPAQTQTRICQHCLAFLNVFFAVFFSGCFDCSCNYFSCDCCDRYDYDDYGGDYDPENEYDSYYDGVWGESRGSEDEEEGCSDEDRSSQSSDEDEGIVKQEDDKTTVPVTDGPHPSAVMETKVDVKQETKEEVLNDSKLEIAMSLAGTVPDATPVACAATGSGTGEQASTSSGIGPDFQTEGKRVSGCRSLRNPRNCI